MRKGFTLIELIILLGMGVLFIAFLNYFISIIKVINKYDEKD